MEIEIGRYPREGWVKHGDIPGYDKDDRHARFAAILIKDTGELKANRGKKICFKVEGTGMYDGKYTDASTHILPSVFGYYDLAINQDWSGYPENDGKVTIYFYDDECPLGKKKNMIESFGGSSSPSICKCMICGFILLLLVIIVVKLLAPPR
jgi:hypothetical protein